MRARQEAPILPILESDQLQAPREGVSPLAIAGGAERAS